MLPRCCTWRPVLLAGGWAWPGRRGALALAALRRLRWQYGSARNYTAYRAAVVAGHSPASSCLGAGAADAAGRRGRVRRALRHRAGPAHRLMTPTLRVIPASTWLADRQDADTWVANWGGWLASLGYLPMVRWVTVTIDTAPEPGTSLADSVAAALDRRRRWPPADHGAARGVGAGRCRRRRHARVDLVRSQAEPCRAC